MSKERLEKLLNGVYYEYLDIDESQELIDYVYELHQENQQLENNWNEFKKWVLCMLEVSHLDIKCLQSVLYKMKELESDK